MKLTPAPKIQFFGDDGLPLSGGKVFTYEQGTTTPLATYSDPAGVSVNTNPVILDTYGRASIYIQDLAYTFLVKDADDVVQGAGGDIPNPAIDTTDFLERTSLTGSAEVPVGSTAQRDGSPTVGYFRFNTTIGHFEGWDGVEWVPFRDESDDEPALGNPATDGLALLSTAAGARSWGVPVPVNGIFLQPIGNFVTGVDVYLRESANHMQVTGEVKCFSQDGKDLLHYVSGFSGIDFIPTVADTTYYVCIVRLVSGGSVTFKCYDSVNGPAADTDISSFAYLFPAFTGSGGALLPAKVFGDGYYFETLTKAPVIAATLTTSLTAMNIGNIVDKTLIADPTIAAVGSATGYCTISEDNSTTAVILDYSSTKTTTLFPRHSTNTFYAKYTTANCALKLHSFRVCR